MYRSLASLALLASPALAFVGTAPLVAWSSSSSATLAGLQAQLDSGGPVADASQALSAALGGADVCSSRVLVISQEDLHAEDLASFPLLEQSLGSAAVRVPYLTSPTLETLDAALADLVMACSGSAVVVKEAGENLESLWTDAGFEVVKVVAKREEVEGESWDGMLRWEDALIAPQVADLLSSTVPHVVVLTGHASPATQLAVQRRQTPLSSPLSKVAAAAAVAPSSSNSTTAHDDLPLLAKYQFISTPVLMMTLVALFVLLPILGLGIAALASIQVPPRMDNVKGIQVGVTLDKKNQ